jgi:hypothetical protein
MRKLLLIIDHLLKAPTLVLGHHARAIYCTFVYAALECMQPCLAILIDEPEGEVRAAALCLKPILPSDDKTTVQGVIHHAHCWDRKQRGH